MNWSIWHLIAANFLLQCEVMSGPSSGNEIEILSIEDCGNPETATVQVDAQLELKTSTTPVANGTIAVNETIDDKVQCKGVLDMQTDLGWQENVKTLDTRNKGICTSLNKYFGNDWFRLLSTAGPPLTGCPIRPNVYRINDILATAPLRSNPLKSGKYRFTLRCHRSENAGVEIACAKFDIDSRPLK
ncbi:Hypothetical protein NTJ_14551 [Nesidiocoris tenuis]|uniref:MD-2-related lipid-recognition domain-containing protein n=1 Tax=Nesidiocoris tenuis TaxID=355587 RepID=A0ABN7BD05_9HEMI|nr:Hypothetical protein NTJ_14551 [Nesidiocoris tenuis]